jgi:endonuclease-3 related protein
MMAGAILTQATNWHNVECALARLRRAGCLSPARIAALPLPRLQRLIRPAGYFRQKARRLRQFARWYLDRYGGRPQRMFGTPWRTLRQELLALDGIGPETADSILCYAGRQPVFVVDAYTARIFRRHRLLRPGASYDRIQTFVMDALPDTGHDYNELHALLVAVGKRHCARRHPDCRRCPLGDLPHTSR